MDLADDVEEEVVGGAHRRGQARDLPPVAGVDRRDEVALRVRVAEGGERRLGAGEGQEAEQLVAVAVADGVEGRGPAGLVPDDALMREPEVVGQGESREAVAEVTVERLLRAEDQAPGVGVQAVGADDEVEGAPAPAAEGHVHSPLAIVEGGDGVVEEELGVVADRVVQDVGEIPAAHLQIAALVAAGQGGGPEGGDRTAVGVQEGDPAGVDMGGP
ncbi:hypothetical protein NDW01_21640 [Actinoallomurus sp. WRP6H-15]|nr:hypothetical protein [Actinoallomurus soli]MCO5971008.1 hypothetical protein [Actinoallomurus soli]